MADVLDHAGSSEARITSGMFIDAPLYPSQDADLTLLVGLDENEFKVHSNIVTAHSKFFKIICRNLNFREGVEKLVRLPEMDAETMKRLLPWFYREPLDLPEDMICDEGYEIVINLLNASDFLEIAAIVKIITETTQSYLERCHSWSSDRDQAAADEQKKIDLLCRIYECGGKVDGNCLKKYMQALKESRYLGLFMNMVNEIEDCHEALFKDIMVALYATPDPTSGNKLFFKKLYGPMLRLLWK
ncbi:hypothetical protein ABW20_dc0102328 [Dactylellina cionopaga]|nr:hypothetical protein ABW20_dc0102328 [Dactylellina cionopaga]